jgi:hypothetical protein
MQVKEIYLVHVDQYIGAYHKGKCPMITYAPADKFIDFAKGLREDYPQMKLRCVVNEGIEEKVRKRINLDNSILHKANHYSRL